MKVSRTFLLLFVVTITTAVFTGFLGSYNTVFAQQNGCGGCAFCASYRQVRASAVFLLFSVSLNDKTPVQQSINGEQCHGNANLYYDLAPCSEGTCAANNGATIANWLPTNADICSGGTNSDYIETSNSINLTPGDSISQTECSYAD